MKIIPFVLLMAVGNASAEIITQKVEYDHKGVTLQGYFAYDDSIQGKRPAVMVVHEWWGHGDYSQRRARELAAMGYLAFANDMYGKGKFADDHKKAAALMKPVRGDYSLMRSRAQAGVDRMLAHDLADGSNAAAIGYCFGGQSVLELARSGADLKGVVSFHGMLDTDKKAKKGKIKAKIAVHHGAADDWVHKMIPDFEKEMTKAEADWSLTTYGGAKHGFTVRERPDVYQEAADKRSWAAMQAFFKEIF